MAHAVIDDVHELQLFALATGCGMIFANRHGFRFMLPILGLEHRNRKFHADLIVALSQFLELLLCDVQFLPSIEVDGVDEKVGMNVFPVCVGADQNFIALIVLSQLQRRRMSRDRIDRFALREALHHVVEEYAVGFVMQPLGGHEVRVDRFRLAVDACDQPLSFKLGFLVLHGVPHHGSHATSGLTPLVVGEADDRHFSPPLSFQDQPDSSAEFREYLAYAVQIDHRDAPHVRQGDKLIQISADGLQLLEHFFQSINDHYLLSQTAGCHIIAHGHPGAFRQFLDGLPVCGCHPGTELDIFFHVVSSSLS